VPSGRNYFRFGLLNSRRQSCGAHAFWPTLTTEKGIKKERDKEEKKEIDPLSQDLAYAVGPTKCIVVKINTA